MIYCTEFLDLFFLFVRDEQIYLGYAEHLKLAISATLSSTNESDEPVKMLRTFVAHLLRGRPLDIRDESELIEGPTTEIFVSRLNIYEDGMDELLSGTSPDYSFPLEVTFTGECAQDLGGPRKEFLGAMMREIRFKLFKEKDGEGTFVLRDDMVAVNRMHYLGAGIIFACEQTTITDVFIEEYGR